MLLILAERTKSVGKPCVARMIELQGHQIDESSLQGVPRHHVLTLNWQLSDTDTDAAGENIS